MANYLIAASPIRGHVLPMLAIGEGLRALGHDITMLTGMEFSGVVAAGGLAGATLPGPTRIAAPPAIPAAMRPLPALARRFLLGRAELDAVFAEPLAAQSISLRSALASRRVDGVLVDVAFTGALPLLLDGAPRPPVVVCGVGPLTLSGAGVPPFGMAWPPRPGVDYRPMTQFAHRVVMRGSQRRFDRALHRAGSRAAPVFIADWPLLADAVAQLSVQEFEYARDDLPARVEFVGPVLPRPAGRFAPPDWWADLDGGRAVLHVTQGTFDNNDFDQLITPTLQALGGRDDVLIVVTTSRPLTTLRTQLPPNTRVAEWIPYAELMPHVDVMITNGGYGGVQYALAHGVPVIVAGETSDKAEVAARVAHVGVGIDLSTSTPRASAVGDAVRRILAGGGGHRAAALRMQRAMEGTAPVDAIANMLKRIGDGP